MVKMKKFFEDLKAFLMKGNIIDMAVGVIVGAAFGKIVSSLVADLVTPLLSLLTSSVSFSEMFLVLNPSKFVPTDKITSISQVITRADAAACGLVTWNWGNFLQTVIDFLLVGTTIFIVLRVIVKAKEKLEAKMKAHEEAEEEEKEPSVEEKILATLEEINSSLSASKE